MEQYPTILPKPMRDDYGIQPGEAVARTPMESGMARQRRRYMDVPATIPVVWKLTNGQMGLFDSWYVRKAREGASFFTIELLSPLGMSAHEARFKKPYKAEPISGLYWKVTAELEIRNRPVLSEEALDVALAEDTDGLIAAIDGVHALVHTTLPGAGGWS